MKKNKHSVYLPSYHYDNLTVKKIELLTSCPFSSDVL